MKRERLIAQRRRLGLSRTEMAKRCEVDRKTYGRWEDGENSPHPPQRRRLAAVIGASIEQVDELFEAVEPGGAENHLGSGVRHRRVTRHLYRGRPTGSPLAAAVEAAGAAARWEHRSSPSTAAEAVAARLGIHAGDPVMATNYRFFADDEPIMLSTSYEPLAVTAGTPIELPEEGPIVGVVARFDSIGLTIDQVQEDVLARTPSPHETEALQVPLGVAVMVVERTYLVAGRPVETADIVVASDVYTLSYVVPIPTREAVG